MDLLKRGARGPEVERLQQLLNQRGCPVDVTGSFGTQTDQAVRAFQSQNLDADGEPLVVDGKVGELSWWSLTHPKPDIRTVSAIDFTQMPAPAAGGSALGRAMLQAAIGELRAGAGEVGGDNRGPWVAKYLAPTGLPEGNSWCAAFVSYCLLQAVGGDRARMPIAYNASARTLLEEGQAKGWASQPQSGYAPQPGDLVVWWRIALAGHFGHVGIVHQLSNGRLYTIEGNHSPNVQGFSYVLSRMDKLLGYVHFPEGLQ